MAPNDYLEKAVQYKGSGKVQISEIIRMKMLLQVSGNMEYGHTYSETSVCFDSIIVKIPY